MIWATVKSLPPFPSLCETPTSPPPPSAPLPLQLWDSRPHWAWLRWVTFTKLLFSFLGHRSCSPASCFSWDCRHVPPHKDFPEGTRGATLLSSWEMTVKGAGSVGGPVPSALVKPPSGAGDTNPAAVQKRHHDGLCFLSLKGSTLHLGPWAWTS